MSEHTDTVTFEELEATDVISVDLVPERKGLILKHCEYYVSSRRHGTTVTRRYNDFVQLYDILSAKYPYRAICRLPPKRVVVGGGSAAFLRRRRAALQRWLTLAARHPVLAHDADLRAFLCEPAVKLATPRHDEFELAGTALEQDDGVSLEELEAAFISDQEQLRLVQLGMARLEQIFEKAEQRCVAEAEDILSLGAALTALAAPAARDPPLWAAARRSLAAAARLASASGAEEVESEAVSLSEDAVALALDALGAARELGARLRRGLHAERAAAARRAHALRRRHLYALRAAAHENGVCLAYCARGVERAAAALGAAGAAHARLAALWARLHRATLP